MTVLEQREVTSKNNNHERIKGNNPTKLTAYKFVHTCK